MNLFSAYDCIAELVIKVLLCIVNIIILFFPFDNLYTQQYDQLEFNKRKNRCAW